MSSWFDPQSARSDPRLAGIWPRFIARIIDVVIVGSILGLVGWILDPHAKPDQTNLGLVALGALVSLLYEVPATAIAGQTLGKRIARIRVVRVEDGARPGANRSLLRYFTAYLSALLPYVGPIVNPVAMLWFLWDPRRQNIPDKVARTLVVKVGQEQPGVINLG